MLGILCFGEGALDHSWPFYRHDAWRGLVPVIQDVSTEIIIPVIVSKVVVQTAMITPTDHAAVTRALN